MNQEAILWIFGILITVVTAVLGKLCTAVIDLKVRTVRIETTFSLYNEKAANILHSPHTPELDSALEQLLKCYNENRDMTQDQWANLLRLVEQIENDREIAKGERMLAAMVSTTCRVKLGMTPDGYRKTL
jgi:hypothetical protein